MKLWIAALIITWFFGFRIPSDDFPNVMISVVMGPFVNENECQNARALMLGGLEVQGVELRQITLCKKFQEA